MLSAASHRTPKRLLSRALLLLSHVKNKVLGRRDYYFIDRVGGLIHIGANVGNERTRYAKHGLDVVWVEALPDTFETLLTNLEGFENQRAYCRLLTDRSGETHKFNVSSNRAASSSVFELAEHKKLWPDVDYVDQVELTSVRLDDFLREEGIDAARYPAVVMDVQGAELLVLKGAGDALRSIRYLKVEAADFEAYAGGCTLAELDAFLIPRGFRRMFRRRFAMRIGTGSYFDAFYERVGCGR